MRTLHTDAEKQERLLVFSKGAPDVLLSRCSEELVGESTRRLTDARRAGIQTLNEEFAAQALRTIAIAYRSVPVESVELEDATNVWSGT
jgi:Ca2+-transporting ATPase